MQADMRQEIGGSAVMEITLDATKENLTEALGFVDAFLESADCPMKTQMQLDIAVEELFVNIASYAYPEGKGTAVLRIGTPEPESVEITFIDSGIPYNPLAKKDPDVSLSAEERQIGGLGIFMVKKSMDAMDYEYKDGQNVLWLKFLI